jgi:hypothetical protein
MENDTSLPPQTGSMLLRDKSRSDPDPAAEGSQVAADCNGSIASNLSAIIDDERLITEGEDAVERFNRSREQILPMAKGLLAAKRRYPATQKFNEWLRGSPYRRIGKQDRAALINLAKNENATAKFMASTDLISPQTIWAAVSRELQPELPISPSFYDSKSEDDSTDANPAVDEKASDTRPDADPPPNDRPIKSKASVERRDPWADGELFDLVLLTPSKGDLKLLLAEYAEPENTLRRCLPLHQVIVQDVAIIIAAKISDYPAITDVLAIYGFKRPSRVLLAGRPDGADVTAAEVFIIAERGDVGFSEPEGGWLNGDDPVEIAQQLYPDVSSSLLVFGSTQADGWQRRSWAEMPTVR